MFEQIDQRRRLEQKDAAVPIEVAGVDELLRDLSRWLLHEAPHLEGGGVALLGLDIAVAGMRAVRLDAEDDEGAFLGGAHTFGDCARECRRVGDHVV